MALPPLEPAQRKNLLYAGVLLALASYGFYDQIYSRRTAELDQLQSRLDQLENVNTRSRALTRRSEGQVDQQLALYRQQLEMAEGLIPSNEELPNLLDAISAEATRTGVSLTLIQPVGATEETYYTRRVYDMAVVGEYHQIGEFLTRVASMPRIVTPTNLVLAPRENAGPPVNTQGTAAALVPLEARFSIETYVIPSTPVEDDASV
jgi:type IV pilus assembly protein PilO